MLRLKNQNYYKKVQASTLVLLLLKFLMIFWWYPTRTAINITTKGLNSYYYPDFAFILLCSSIVHLYTHIYFWRFKVFQNNGTIKYFKGSKTEEQGVLLFPYIKPKRANSQLARHFVVVHVRSSIQA